MKRIDDIVDKYINPIVLQESRYILSLRRSLVIYLFLVLVMSISSCSITEKNGDDTSIILLGCFSLVSIGIIPGQLLLSNRERWSKEKLEMLQLTPLRPIQIVLGRLGAALALVIVILSLMLPFLALTYLVPGSDLPLNLLAALTITSASVLAITSSINMAWLSEGYSFHSLGKLFWLFILIQFSISLMGFPVLLEDLSNDDKLGVGLLVIVGVVGILLLSIYFIARSVVFLRHPEENKSTPIRVSLVLALFFGLMCVCALVWEQSKSVPMEGATVVLTSIPFLFLGFLVELDKLGRRALLDLPAKRWKRILMMPLLPGPGTGIIFFGLSVIGLAFCFEGMNYFLPAFGGSILEPGGYLFFAMWSFSIFASGLPLFRHIEVLQSERYRRLAIFGYIFCVFCFIWFLFEGLEIGYNDQTIIYYLLIPFEGMEAIQGNKPESASAFFTMVTITLLVIGFQYRTIKDNVMLILKYPVSKSNI
jgi:hypothetical protein